MAYRGSWSAPRGDDDDTDSLQKKKNKKIEGIVMKYIVWETIYTIS